MELNKILGIILLVIGLLIIFWGIFSAYNVFQGRANLPKIFIAQEEAILEDKMPSNSKNILSPEAMQESIEQMIGEQVAKFLPAGNLMQMMNLIALSMFLWILIYGGGKIAGLGIKLLK